jgi:uronate dehydrogenase
VLTGAGGKIATSIRPGLADRVAQLRLVDLDLVEPAHEREESVVADIRDQRAVEAALVGAAGVLHLGALADEADFHELAEVNILGTYHVLEAARRTGAGRVVFASSNRVTGFYPRTTLVDPEMPTRPDGFYGVSKIAGEALGRLYSDKFGLQVASLRIGSFEPTPADERQLSTWLSPSDCEQAFLAAMTAPELTYTAVGLECRGSRRVRSAGRRRAPCGRRPGGGAVGGRRAPGRSLRIPQVQPRPSALSRPSAGPARR